MSIISPKRKSPSQAAFGPSRHWCSPMTNRTRSVEDGGTTGFRRLFDYKNAIPPRDLRALLDPQQEDLPHREGVWEGLKPHQRAGLEAIDAVAEEVRFFDKRLMRITSSECLAFACALEHATTKARLRAMLARAFARADRFAFACAEELEIRTQAESLANALNKAIAALSGPDGILWDKNRVGSRLYKDSAMNRALTAFHKMGHYTDKEQERWRDNVCHGLEIIENIRFGFAKWAEIEEEKRKKNKKDYGFGWPVRDEARFFFLLRLAEVFAISTGEVPTFSGHQAKKEINGRKQQWSKFARAALDLTGLGVSGFDDLNRRLGGKRPNLMKSPFEKNYEWQIISFATWFDPDSDVREVVRRQTKSAGQLLTAGRAIDHRDPGEPWNWEEHRI